MGSVCAGRETHQVYFKNPEVNFDDGQVVHMTADLLDCD